MSEGTLRGRREDGYVVLLTALLLVPMLVVAAFAVDVGGWYARASRVQRAADAASLAGVVWMPNFAKAQNVALAAAARNGFAHDPTGTGVVVQVSSPAAQQLTVRITAGADVYLGQLVFDDMSVSRDATAEYILPVPLGSRANRLGNDPTTGYSPNLWGSISGPYTDRVDGDPYSTKCPNGSSGSGCSGNAEYRTNGYLYAIDPPDDAAGRRLTLEIYDAGHYHRPNYANVETADRTNGGLSGDGVHTQFELFEADDTPLDTSDNLVPAKSMSSRCVGGSGPGRQYIAPESSAGTFMNRWFPLCSVDLTAPKVGQWFLQVKSSSISGVLDSGSGWNQYSLRATLSGPGAQPQLHAINDLSLFNNLPGLIGTFDATFDLARVDEVHRGKRMQIDLYDPGDGQSGNYFVNVVLPDGSAAPSCDVGLRGTSLAAKSPCRIQTRSSSGNQYNGQWLRIEIPITSSYACAADCWWQIRYEFEGVLLDLSPNDRTVWAAQIIGDPVHLIE
jgi:hypothetical protein